MSAKVLSFTNQTQLDASLALKAPIANPALTGFCTLTATTPYLQLNSPGQGQGLLGVSNWYGVYSNSSYPGDTVLRSSNGKRLLVQSGDNMFWGGMMFDSSNPSYPTIQSWSSLFTMNSNATVTGLLTTSGLNVTGQSTLANIANFENEIRSTSTQNGNVANVRLIHSTNASILKQDDTFFYIKLTNVGVENTTGNTNALRPFTITNSTGDVAMGSNVRVGAASSSALPARFAVASGNSNSGNITSWNSNWSIFGGDGSATSSSLGLGNDGSSSWMISLAPNLAWKNLNSRASSHNWYDTSAVSPFLSGSGAGVVLNTGLNMGLYNITSDAGIQARNITATGNLHATSLFVHSNIESQTLQLFTAGVDIAGNITGTTLTLTGGLTCPTINSGAITSSGLLTSQSVSVGGGSAGISSSGNMTGTSLTVSGTVNAVTINAQNMNVSCLCWEGNTNISGTLGVTGNISGLTLNAGNSVLGNVSASLLRVSGNVSGLSLNAGASVLGAVTADSLSASGNVSGVSLNAGASTLGAVSAASLSASGNVSGATLTAGTSTLGAVSADSLATSGNISGVSLNCGDSVFGNVSASSLSSSGNMSGLSLTVGNINALNVSGSSFNVGSLISLSGGNISGMSLNANIATIANITSNSVRVDGNVSCIGIVAGASTLGAITSDSLRTTGNISGFTLTIGQNASIINDLTVGNSFRAASSIDAGGNISGGSFHSTGNSVFGDVTVGTLSAFGNVSASSLTTSILYANGTKFGLFGKASPLNATTQALAIPDLDPATTNVSACANSINLVLAALRNYGLISPS